MRPIRLVPLAAFLLALASCAAFPGAPPAEEFTLVSARTGTAYQIRVGLPLAWESSGGPYDVVYALDGDETFDATWRALCELEREGAIAPTILVATGYGSGPNLRERDYTPTDSGDGESGGADDFLAFLVEELAPRVESSWNASPNRADRILTGHSFGALFALHVLLSDSSAFGSYIATSPSLWWDSNFMFAEEGGTPPGFLPAATTCYMSVGSLEGGGMNALFSEFRSRLLSRDEPSLALRAEVVANARHYDYRYRGFVNGMRFVAARHP